MPLIVADTLEALQYHRPLTQRLACVPTMGNLHAGHLRLIELAFQHADHVVVSIFVNRLQFGPHEDFERYPRSIEQDCHVLESLGKNILVFAPQESTLYPIPQTFRIAPTPMADTLEGYFRPDFFGGVCTIVMKLLHIVAPHCVIFGKKDRQQLTLIRQMITQFNIPIQLIESETIRNSDGLALSSRNQYLSSAERTQAPQLYNALKNIADTLRQNSNPHYRDLENHATDLLQQHGWKVDYIAIRDTATLSAYPNHTNIPTVVLGAAHLGKTRLIDNLDI